MSESRASSERLWRGGLPPFECAALADLGSAARPNGGKPLATQAGSYRSPVQPTNKDNRGRHGSTQCKPAAQLYPWFPGQSLAGDDHRPGV
ncbi:hypothetical protein C1X69_24705 [Pseudomonas sp. FW305-67]|nr:hypothetical protein C1X70_23445 [Pseudomonas sp. FW305-53]PMY85682.1 hypothetical protein C1X68_17945 [Pseudomonas sp. FW303-C2]PMY92888.1 hypothetical protein C1X67_10795 [Pseudomonas sp. FW305-62]PNA44401.1 hypothetical protein C1X71_08290 [Pseudomonas sp. FW306-2-2C-A10BC]PNA83062.1 hypothetical protein C1X66_25930 [Pseudomonas sp. MPR-R3B]PNB14578.1 hypothetical protein C1X69_24705 [Pseudomonas sp. FW305-67]